MDIATLNSLVGLMTKVKDPGQGYQPDIVITKLPDILVRSILVGMCLFCGFFGFFFLNPSSMQLSSLNLSCELT